MGEREGLSETVERLLAPADLHHVADHERLRLSSRRFDLGCTIGELRAALNAARSNPAPPEGVGAEPVGCPIPGACACPSEKTPDERARIICDFMGWPEDGPAWSDAHKLAAMLVARRSPSPEAGVGDWVLVPREPTEEMVERGRAEVMADRMPVGRRRAKADVAFDIYRAMLAAAPPEPGGRAPQSRATLPDRDLEGAQPSGLRPGPPNGPNQEPEGTP